MFTDQPKLRLVKNDGAIPCSLELTNTNAIGKPNKNAKIADTPFNVGVNDQVFLLFGNKAIGLVVHGLNTRIKHLHGFNKWNLEVQARCNNQWFVVIVT